MRILQVDLDNVKSYRHARVPFTPGTNAICGHNGAGKSTLLEAIGFALFDFLAVKQDDFVREGEKTATVTVHVTDADGRVYHVVRRCGGSSQYYVYDPELDRRLTEGKAETALWLREFLGVELTADLPVLFRDAVGVPQGLLTAAFLETAGRRKDVFNPLLRVDEYERVWDALRVPRRQLERQIAGEEKRIAGLTAEVKGLPDLRAQLADLTAHIAQSMQRQSDLQVTLEDVVARKTRLEALKNQLDALDKHVAQAEAALQTLAARQTDAQSAVERAAAAQSVVAATADAHRAYLAAEAQMAALESERVARDKAQDALQKCAHARDLAQQALARLEQTLTAISAAEAEMATLAPQVAAQNRLDAALDVARRAVEQRKTAEQTLTRERQRLMEMDSRLATMRARLQTRATVEADVQTARTELDAHNARREALTAQLSAQQAEIKAIDAQVKQAARRHKDAQRDWERAQQQLVELEAKRADVRRGLKTLAEVETHIETLQAAIADLNERDRACTARLAADRAELERLHTQSTVLTGAEAANCPVCGAPLSPEHRAALLTQNQARVAELDAAIAESRAQQDAVGKERRDHEKTLRALDRKIKRLPRPAEAEEIAAQIAVRQGELAEREAAVAEARADVAALETRRTALEAALDELEPQLAATEATRDAQQRAVRELEAQLEALPRPAEAETLAEHVEAQRQIVAESEVAVAALRDAPDELARVETKLAVLGDPRRAYQRAGDVAAQREATDARHAETVACIGELEVQHKALTVQMAVYANLDARLSAARAARDARAPDHQRYLQHEREAASLAECRTALAALQAEVQAAEARRDEHVAARDALAAQYDAAAYAALVARHGALREELAALDASLQHRRTQQATVQTEIARLEVVQRDLEGAQAERDELAEVHALLEHLRQVLRDAGPEVTRTLVAMISLHADRLYADIMQSYAGQNPATHLRWTEDYDIVLTSEGRDRTFQQLSGGEQMAAALAVRLALLREVSTVDVAFFDEPTANLDRDRRANLAAQILNVKGFSQLFVISHDDTFEQDTDYVVRIEKVDGESRVAAE